MQQEPFLALCKKRNFDEAYIQRAMEDLKTFEMVLKRLGNELDTCTENELKEYINHLIQEKQNTLERFLTLARYFNVINRMDLYRYFLAILGGLGVIESMKKRTEQFTDSQTAEEIFTGVDFPALGSPIDENPVKTVELLKRMRDKLPDEVFKKILAGNHHGIPPQRFEEYKEKFKELGNDIDAFLKYLHDQQVTELDEYCKKGKIWFEQVLTPEAVQYIREHPEIQGGVREGSIIYITKIPFDTPKYIQETDPDLKRYNACHCPFVRTSLLLNEEKAIPEWCYCSAGFEKLIFDAIYGKELRVEVLETPFKGDLRCRFAVHID